MQSSINGLCSFLLSERARMNYQISARLPRQSFGRGNCHGGNVMTARVTRQINDSITIEVTLPLTGSMLQAEEAIQDALNEVGLLATEEKLKRFDTDGSPIQLGSVHMTSKGQFAQDYETPYGIVAVPRHVYQIEKA